MVLVGLSTSMTQGQTFIPAVSLAMSLVEGSDLNFEKSTLLFSKEKFGGLPRVLRAGFFTGRTPYDQ